MRVRLHLLACTGLAALLLGTPSPAEADPWADAREACREFTARTGDRCEAERCPCGLGKRRYKEFNIPNRVRDVCACVSRAAIRDENRERAERACADYRELFGTACEVKSGRLCGVGLIRISRGSGGPFLNYVACRQAIPLERLRTLANALVLTAPHAVFLISQYNKWMAFLASRADTPTPLRADLVTQLQRHYPLGRLADVRIAVTRTSYQGCTTDCSTIYCGLPNFVQNVRTQALAALRLNDFKLLLHELAHTEQCLAWGGRNRYAMTWFRGLAPAAVQTIGDRDDKALFVQLHDEMPMEVEAERKAEQVCAALGRPCP